jgi:hypothetical protein
VRLENETGRKVAVRMLSSEPVGGEGELLVKWVLEPELSARAMRIRCDHILREVVPAKCYARACVKRLAELSIKIIARIITFVANGHEQIIANYEGPSVVSAIISSPFDRRH